MKDNLAEWLRRETRNLMGFPAQVRILQLSDILLLLTIFCIKILKYYINLNCINLKVLSLYRFSHLHPHFWYLTTFLTIKPSPSPTILPLTPSYGWITEKSTSSPKCSTANLISAYSSGWKDSFKKLSKSSSSSDATLLVDDIKVKASIKSGSIKGFSIILVFM